MNDPYKVLGVSPNATDDEIKTAYRNLAKKYHPDNYADSPLSDLASEKMKEVNEAYDEVIRQRKDGASAGSSYSAGNPYSGAYNNNPTSSYSSAGYTASSYPDVRNMMQGGRFADAEQILNGVPTASRNAEWFYLKGTVLYRRGWLDEAYTNLQTACQREPSNAEYRMALNRLQTQRGGTYGGYNMNQGGSVSGCDICTSLWAADCCCECMGGDLIPCC